MNERVAEELMAEIDSLKIGNCSEFKQQNGRTGSFYC
jgi:hypothetical protein